MPKIHELILRVREADEADFGKNIVRIHPSEKPQGIMWGESVNISVNKKNWVTCKLERAGRTGIGHIYIGIHTRGLINRHTTGLQIVKLNETCDFYIKKAIPWKAITFIVIGVIIAAVILSLVYLRDLL